MEVEDDNDEDDDDDDEEEDEEDAEVRFIILFCTTSSIHLYRVDRALSDACFLLRRVQEDGFEEIDPSAILPRSRRGGPRIDYSSEEAHKKAGLTGKEAEDEDDSMVEE